MAYTTSVTSAAASAFVVTDPTPSVLSTVSAVLDLAPVMGAMKNVPASTEVISGSSTGSSAAPQSGRSDAIHPAVMDQEVTSEPHVRSLSGSRLNAKAPEFVPKGAPEFVSKFVTQPLSGLKSTTSLPVPGVIPVVFLDSAVSPLRYDSAPTPVSTAPTVITTSASPSVSPDGDESFLAEESTSPQPHLSAPIHPHHQKTVVNDELKAKIVKQVEFYFSDQNLPTDNYLMKFLKKDPDGFVPIPVVASFRKIKNLVKNHGVVAAALRGSTQLIVSDDGKKVRRIHPLPQVDLEEVQSRTVVAENLPEDHSIESLEKLFSSVGNVKMVRICLPEAANGANQTAAKFKSDMVISIKLHALVEFETIEQAEKAVAALTDQGNWRSGLRVRLLLRRTFQSKHGFQQGPFQKGRKMDENGGEDEDGGTEDKTSDDGGHLMDRNDDANGNETNATGDRDAGMKKGKGRGRGRGISGRGKSHQGGSHHTGSNGVRPHQLGTSPQTSQPLVGSEVVGRPPPGPRMPDGTRGFTLGRGKAPVLGPV